MTSEDTPQTPLSTPPSTPVRIFRGACRRVASVLVSQGARKSNAFFNAWDDIAWSRTLRKEITEIARTSETHDIRELRIASLKSSDTLFILGSGASIAELDEAALEHIRRHDSLGLNFWLIHPFVPTYCFLEFSPNRDRNDVMIQLLERRAAEYSDVPLIFEYKDCRRVGEDLTRIPEALRSNLYLHAPWCLGTPWPGQVRRGVQLWSRLERHGWLGMERMIHHRTSLTVALMFGVLCRYNTIVLLGVDLNHTEYFWQKTPARYTGVPQPPTVETGPIHSTANAELNLTRGTLSVPEYLDIFRQCVLEPRQIRYFVGSRSSALVQSGWDVYERWHREESPEVETPRTTQSDPGKGPRESPP